MPPNLGGFFMVRSYYPSECHADYFDFERIEALKPAIEACGRSEERFSRNAETELVCRLLLEKKKKKQEGGDKKQINYDYAKKVKDVYKQPLSQQRNESVVSSGL